MSEILELVTDLRYKAGIEKIESAYKTLIKGKCLQYFDFFKSTNEKKLNFFFSFVQVKNHFVYFGGPNKMFKFFLLQIFFFVSVLYYKRKVFANFQKNINF